MNTTTIIVIAVLVVIALLFLFLLRGRKQHVSFGDATPMARQAPPAPAVPAAPIVPPAPSSVPMAAPAMPVAEEGHGVGSEMTAAIEDVIDQFVGIDAHPSGQPLRSGAGDQLTLMKGLGPKAASRLAELGVTRFDQIAAWDANDVAAIDREMGAFKGRIARDRWVDQAKLLASGDRGAFEAEFGKLGQA